MNDRELQYRITALERQLQAVVETSNTMVTEFQSLDTNAPIVNENLGKQQNFVRNGDFDHTRNTYNYVTDYSGSATVDADVSEESAYWYAHSASATELFEDTTDDNIDANETTNTALKTTAHSRFASTTNNPRFDKVNGWVELGANATLDAPLTDNFCKASKQYILSFACRLQAKVTDGAITSGDNTYTSATAQFTADDVGKSIVVAGAGASGADLSTTIASYTSATEVELTASASTTVSNAVTTFEIIWDNETAPRLFCGIWDNTSGQRKYLQSADLTLTAKVVGTPSGTTSREYFVIARTAWGKTIGTNVVTVANAPNDASYNATTYVSLSWTGVVGAVAYDIYRKTGSTFHALKLGHYPQNSFFDANSPDKTVVAYPTADDTKTSAYVQTNQYNFQPTSEWQRFPINIPIPDTYNQANTTNKQWLRIGLTSAIVGAGMKWGLQLDLVSLDDGNGNFSRSPLDFFVKRGNAITADSGSQGTIGTGGGGGVVPPGDTDFCPVFDVQTQILLNGEEQTVTMIELFQLWENKPNVLIKTRRNEWTTIDSIKISNEPKSVYTLLLGNEKAVTCSENQPFFSDETDTLGKSLKTLSIGDKIQTDEGITEVISVIHQVRKRSVISISLNGVEKGFWMNGIAGHNRKYRESFLFE
jgi:hypothetical protein